MKNTDFGIGYQFRGGGIDFKNWPKVELVDPGLVYAIGTHPDIPIISFPTVTDIVGKDI